MRIIHFDEKEGKMKIEPESLEDLWHLEKIISEGDIVIAHSERKFKPEFGKAERKKVTIELRTEKIELHKHANILRVMGKILGGSPEEYVQVGSYHTIDVVPHHPFVIKKEEWTTYHKGRITEAIKASKRPIIDIVVVDDHFANVVTLRGYGIENKCEIRSRTSKRDPEYEQKMKKYFSEIASVIEESKKIIVAGPGFTKDSFRDYLKEKNPKLLKKINFEHTSTAEKSGIYELLKTGAITKVVEDEEISKEFEKIENFLAELKKESGLAVYGPKEVTEAIKSGMLKELYITDELVRKDPKVLDEAKSKKVDVTIFTSEEEPNKKLKAFGGIAGILRYRIT